jgi:diguanylate cyclase (GGDEF)-like protein
MMRYLHSLERSPDRRRIAGIAMDLDGFKAINDRFGHQTGDRALEEAAHIIRDSIRRNDFLARMGGDEFTVILETDNIAVVNEVVDRIRSNFERARTSPDRPYELAISIGWGVYDRAKDLEIGAFLSRIDTALYDDKRLHGATAC